MDRATLAVEGNEFVMSDLPTRKVTEAGTNHDEREIDAGQVSPVPQRMNRHL
jgi:hypothetical protein